MSLILDSASARRVVLEARLLYAENLIRQVNANAVIRISAVRLLEWHELPEHVRLHWEALAFLLMDDAQPDIACPIDSPIDA